MKSSTIINKLLKDFTFIQITGEDSSFYTTVNENYIRISNSCANIDSLPSEGYVVSIVFLEKNDTKNEDNCCQDRITNFNEYIFNSSSIDTTFYKKIVASIKNISDGNLILS